MFQSRMRPQSIRRAVVVIAEYSAPTGNQSFRDSRIVGNCLAWIVRAMRRRHMRDHVRFYRDYHANPKPLDALRERAPALLARHALAAQELVDTHGFVQRRAELAERFDAVVLAYPDALGLGQGWLERCAQAAFGARVYILNGRGRCFPLDAGMARVLRRRRFLAETRLVEAAMATLVRFGAPALALYDRLVHDRRR